MNGFKYIRKNILNKTMDELAKELSVSKQVVYMWESGRKNVPLKRMKQLVELSGVPENYFFILAVSERDKQTIQQYYLNKELNNVQKESTFMGQIKDFITENSVGEGYLSNYGDFYMIPKCIFDGLN
jgi:transcriptional regulator with XRE-family HTH domain